MRADDRQLVLELTAGRFKPAVFREPPKPRPARPAPFFADIHARDLARLLGEGLRPDQAARRLGILGHVVHQLIARHNLRRTT